MQGKKRQVFFMQVSERRISLIKQENKETKGDNDKRVLAKKAVI